jgi:hypothetical protein
MSVAFAAALGHRRSLIVAMKRRRKRGRKETKSKEKKK